MNVHKECLITANFKVCNIFSNLKNMKQIKIAYDLDF